MDRNRWLLFGAVCVLLLGTLVYFSRSDQVDVSNVNGAQVITGSEEGTFEDNVYGNADSEVVLVEYGDFQCPGCAGVATPLKEVKMQYEDDIAFVYRHFPLTSIHPNALAAAAASEAAANQGKFWEMHDILFQRQGEWKSADGEARNETFENYAAELSLDLEQFRNNISSQNVTAKINFHRSLGGDAGVDSTPTLYLNGEPVPAAVTTDLSNGDGEQIRELIEEAIENSN